MHPFFYSLRDNIVDLHLTPLEISRANKQGKNIVLASLHPVQSRVHKKHPKFAGRVQVNFPRIRTFYRFVPTDIRIIQIYTFCSSAAIQAGEQLDEGTHLEMLPSDTFKGGTLRVQDDDGLSQI